MEELELLKSHWNKQDHFPKKTKTELQNIIKKSSSNTLKWMIAANIFELLLLILLGIIFGSSTNHTMEILKNESVQLFFKILDYIIIAVPIIFSIIYINMIRKIHVTDSISDLLNNILNARKFLNIYIYINLFIFIGLITFSVIYSYDEAIKFEHNEVHNLSDGTILAIKIFSVILTFIIFSGAVWLFYKLLYGKLLKRLKRNITDLNKN